jgi:hypothetical protein
MSTKFRPIIVSVVAGLLVAGAGSAMAGVGKKVSSATGGFTGTIAAYPSTTTLISVAAPTAYKSKANFLKVTVTYQGSCVSGDRMGALAFVGAVPIPTDVAAYDASTDGFRVTTHTFILEPESLGGPTVPAASNVAVRLTSNSGTGCASQDGVVVVEALK